MARSSRILAAVLLFTLSASMPTGLSAQMVRETHEPQGFERLTHLGFEGTLPEGWTKRERDAFEFVPNASAPSSPPGIGRAYFRTGFQGGRGPVRLNWEITKEYRSLYLSFWVRLSDRWMGHRSGVNKIFHLWIDGGNKAYLSAQGSGPGPYAPQVRLQGIAERPVSRNVHPNSGARLRRGEWYHWEVLLVANTPGVRDGRVQWWINGKPAGGDDHVAFVGPKGRNYWTLVSWNPTWGGMGGSIPSVQWMDMDEIYISAGR